MAVFTNSTALTVGPNPGAANVYPSEITVADLVGTVTKVTVALINLTSAFNADLEVVLQSPDAKFTMLMGDCGNTGATPSAVTLTFDQSAANNLHNTPGQAFVTGTYKPTNYVLGGADTNLPSPAPAASPLPYATNLDIFNGIDPNGVWKLFVYDDGTGDSSGIAGGWSITITTTGSSTQVIYGANLRVINRLSGYPVSSSGASAGIKSVVRTVGSAANVDLTAIGMIQPPK
jgi:subtilisin-like proprotein convertase family protein